jgi:hypothetical protein
MSPPCHVDACSAAIADKVVMRRRSAGSVEQQLAHLRPQHGHPSGSENFTKAINRPLAYSLTTLEPFRGQRLAFVRLIPAQLVPCGIV